MQEPEYRTDPILIVRRGDANSSLEPVVAAIGGRETERAPA